MATAWLAHEEYCAAIESETALLRATLRGGDLGRKVPSCPEWTLNDLAVHVGQAHRWAAEMVRRPDDAELPDDAAHVPDYDPAPGAEELDAWLASGARLLAGRLREAGPDVPMWSWWSAKRSGFWARRMAQETLVHRADAALGAGQPFEATPVLAANAVDEWLDLVTDAEQVAGDPDLHELLGTGQTLRLRADDTAAVPDLDPEWVIVRHPDRVEWRRGPARAEGDGDVTLRGSLTDVLQVLMRRLPPDSDRVEVLGDRALLDHWLARTSF